MSSHKPLSYQNWKCIFSHLHYCTRMLLAMGCPSLARIHRETPAKIKSFTVMRNALVIDSVTYELNRKRIKGCDCLQFLTLTENSRTEKMLHYNILQLNRMGYLIKKIFGYWADKEVDGCAPVRHYKSLEPEILQVASIKVFHLGNFFYFLYPYYSCINTAGILTVMEEIPDNYLTRITNPIVNINLMHGDELQYAGRLVKAIQQMTIRPTHFSVKCRTWRRRRLRINQFRQEFGKRTKTIQRGEERIRCVSLISIRAAHLEVNVYSANHIRYEGNQQESEYSIEISVCPRGTAVPFVMEN